MGTTNTTSNSSQLQFNPAAQGIYNSLIQGGGNILSGYMNNPFGNATYQLGAGQSQKGAQQAGANNMSALMQNMLTSGMSGQAGAGFKQAQMAQTGRANQAMSSQANTSNVLAALQRQMQATGMGMSFSPQLTGQTGQATQTQSGAGTWLPQLLGGGLGALMSLGNKAGGGSDPLNLGSGANAFAGMNAAQNPMGLLQNSFGNMGPSIPSMNPFPFLPQQGYTSNG